MRDLVAGDHLAKLPERYQRRAREIAERVSQIAKLCQPASAAEIGAELKRLRGQFRPQPDIDTRDMAEGFLHACRDLPAWAISEAANDFLAGRVDNHTGQFMPTCAEFAKRARSILVPFLSERAALRTEASKIVERAEDDARRHIIAMERQDPKVRQRVAVLVENAMAGLPVIGSQPHRDQPAGPTNLDAYRKPRVFESKITQTKIGRSQ
jgi:hypothetical protein